MAKYQAGSNIQEICSYGRNVDIDTDRLVLGDELADTNGTDVFSSSHANSTESPAADGTEVYHYSGSVQSKRLATEMNTADRGGKRLIFKCLGKRTAWRRRWKWSLSPMKPPTAFNWLYGIVGNGCGLNWRADRIMLPVNKGGEETIRTG